MDNKKYWQSFGAFNNSEAYRESAKNEFREELPFEDNSKGILDTPTPRRDFLKYLGFSTAAAAMAASCETPVNRAIPFAVKPENVHPGEAMYYATTFVQDGYAESVVAKVRDGRPIKIEGNTLCPITKGGTSARAQASVLDLYNTARLRFPTISGKEVTLSKIDESIQGAIASPAVILTSTIVSPTSQEVINRFLAKYPGSRHVTYDAVSYSGLLMANEASYGRRALPSYRFDNANVIVSIGADFLGTWISPVEFTRQYTRNRKIDEKNPSMSKHFQFESVLTTTGASADERFLCRPSEWGAIAQALLGAVGGQSAAGIADAALSAGIAKAAKALSDNRGRALVVCGSNDANLQLVVNAINEAIGANGSTIDWSATNNTKKGVDADFVQLLNDMNAGAVKTLIVHGANPAYAWHDEKAVKAAFAKVPNTIALSEKNDETTQLCKFVVPVHNYLESWGDAEPKTGHISFIQPTINPLFKTRQWQDSLLKWAGEATTYADLVKTTWSARAGGDAGWNKLLQEGVLNPGGRTTASSLVRSDSSANGNNSDTASAVLAAFTPTRTAPATYNSGSAVTAAGVLSTAKKGGETELVLYQSVAIGDGSGASNPFLQEMPDPITRATWDNYIIVSPDFARRKLNIDISKEGQADSYEVNPEKEVLKLTVNGKSIELPFIIVPGTHPNVVGIAVGYGRTKHVGKAADGYGKNAFPLASFADNTVSYVQPDVKIERTGKTYQVAQVQTHDRYDPKVGGERREIMKELSLATFKNSPEKILNERAHELAPWGGLENFEKQGTLYPYYDKPGIHWGMSVDTNSCTGCGACVVACNIENNVPIVGKSEVARFHDMHWLRIDRYYSGDIDNPKVVFQPLMCQHCDNAPCENVCPVNATNHNSEGLNQMAYNRCIGTRYCANNCPYKVRRFNWADYNGADSFKNNQDQKLVGVLDAPVLDMNDSLTRMVLNPDVTVRSRGVMEKCTFCVQRLQEGKLKAKKEGRKLDTGTDMEKADVKTACQQACPGDAIVFGNINDTQSSIAKVRKENRLRLFYSLEQLHVLPNVNYLAKVRNTDEVEKDETPAPAAHH